MTDTETVQEQVPEVVQEQLPEAPVDETQALDNAEVKEEVPQEQNVPLSTHIKERKRRQEAEQRVHERDQELRMFREHQLKQMQQPENKEEDDSQYEIVTKADLKQQEAKFKQLQVQGMRDAEEKTWIRQNPEKAEVINEKLANFLKQRPNLAPAIEQAPNRYEEAWELMDKLSPKQKAILNNPQVTKKVTPNSPSGVSKAAAINQTVEFSAMTDAEFNAWRQSKRSRR